MPTSHLAPTAMPLPERAGQALGIARRDRRRGTTLTLTGELGADNAARLTQVVQECLDAGHHTIDLDLAELTACDISGLHALHDVTWLTAAAGGRLRLENLCPDLIHPLTPTGPHHLFTAMTLRDAGGLPRPDLSDGAGSRGPLAPGARLAG